MILNAVAVIIGLVVSLALEFAVRWVLNMGRGHLDTTPPEGIDAGQWEAVIQLGGRGPVWLGRLERALFFFALYLGALELAAGWLVFKVGSKWEIWNNLIKVPAHLDNVDDAEYLRARHAWGSRVYHGFLIGTLANVNASIVGWVAYQVCAQVFEYL